MTKPLWERATSWKKIQKYKPSVKERNHYGNMEKNRR